MIDDYDLEFTRREARLVRERDYWADRYRDSRLWRRDADGDYDRYDADRDFRRGDRFSDRVREREAEAADDDDVEEAVVERRLLGIAGFGMGGGGAMLIVLGVVLMALAYFGFGGGGYDAGAFSGYSPYDADGYSPAIGPIVSSVSGYGGGGEVFSQRPMMFMGGGVLFLAGWILSMSNRVRA